MKSFLPLALLPLALFACTAPQDDEAAGEAGDALSAMPGVAPRPFRRLSMDHGRPLFEQELTFEPTDEPDTYLVGFTSLDYTSGRRNSFDRQPVRFTGPAGERVGYVKYAPGNCRVRLLGKPWGFWADLEGSDCRSDALLSTQAPYGPFLLEARTLFREYELVSGSDGARGQLFVYDVGLRPCASDARTGAVTCQPIDLTMPESFSRGMTFWIETADGRAEHTSHRVPKNGVIPQEILGANVDHSEFECRITLEDTSAGAATTQDGTCSPGSGPATISRTRSWRLVETR